MAKYDLEEFLSEGQMKVVTMGEELEQDERPRSELVEDCYDSEGREILNDMRSLYTTLQMVNKNYQLLVQKREEFVNQDAVDWMTKPDQEIQEFFREYLRRLHNYAASVHTLTHHTYTFFDRYENKAPDLKSKYSEELRRRNLDVKVNLLKQIRHYTQKNWEPPLAANISPSTKSNNSDTLELYLKKQEMLDWDGWSSDTRDYLENMDSEIDITQLAEEYQTEVNDFYDWLRLLIMSSFYNDLIETITAQLILGQERDADWTSGHRETDL